MHHRLVGPARFSGVGLHGGARVEMAVRPAPAGAGIAFERIDLNPGTLDPVVRAHWDAVAPSALCTRLENGDGVAVSTVEHVMAALAGLGVQDALVEIDGAEVPVLDGSSAPFVHGLIAAGLRPTHAPPAIEVLEPVEVRDGDAVARLEPAGWLARGQLSIDFRIDFPDAAIGRQRRRFTLRPGAFAAELARARTFCRAADVERMRASGLALGGTVDNAVVVDGAHVLSPGGLRHRDEAVRHKMLDALGDLALAGRPIHGRYVGVRAGHRLTNQLLRALFVRTAAWRLAEARPVPAPDGAPEPIAGTVAA